MSDAKVSTDVVRQVWRDDEGVCIEVGPWPDDPELVEIRTRDKKSVDWWGPINVSFSREFARQLGAALIAAANDPVKG